MNEGNTTPQEMIHPLTEMSEEILRLLERKQSARNNIIFGPVY
jgi:hypothetical protein